MVRLYVPSTPATRGEVEADQVAPEPSELTLEQLQAEAGKLGYELTVKKADGDPADSDPDALPKGNASVEDWTAYALAHGKTEADLTVDGKPLGRDGIKALFEPKQDEPSK